MTGGQWWGPPSTTTPPPQHVQDTVGLDALPEYRDQGSDVPAYFTPPRPTPAPVSSGPSRRIRPTHPRSSGARSGSRTDPAVLVSALVMIALAVAVMVGLLTS